MSIEDFQQNPQLVKLYETEAALLGYGKIISVPEIIKRLNKTRVEIRESILNNLEFKERLVGYVLGKDSIENRTEPLSVPSIASRINSYVPKELKEYVLRRVREQGIEI